MTARFPFPVFPNGWYVIAFSEDVATGALQTVHYFGQDIVVYRTADGQAHAVEPHCPHLGAHFGHGGRVVEDKLRCPFHGWCFDTTGQCVEVPGATKLPRAATTRWALREFNGVIFVYYHAAGAAPDWEAPALPEEGWTANKNILWTLRSHPQEVCENIVDSAHLTPLHGVESASILRAPVADEDRFNIALNLIAPGDVVGMPGTTNDVVLDVTLWGLGYMVVQTHVRNVDIRARQRIYSTPIDGERIHIRGVVNLKALDDPETTEMVAELFFHAYVADFTLDFPIWENKRYRERPILAGNDGPFGFYRKWATRFYAAANAARTDADLPEAAPRQSFQGARSIP